VFGLSFCETFYVLCEFSTLMLFQFKSLFRFSFWVKPWFLVQFMVESVTLGRPVGFFMGQVLKALFVWTTFC